MSQIGETNESLILKCNGILLLKIGNRTINMLDTDGNLNIKLKNVIKSEYPESNSPDGIYSIDGKIWVKSGGSIYQVAVGGKLLPKGSIILYQGTNVPEGWTRCDDISTGINGVIYIKNDENSEIELYTLRFKWKVNGEQISNFQAILGKTTEFPVLEMEAFDSEGHQITPIPFSVNTKYNSTYPGVANISSTNGNIELKTAGLTIIGVRSEENNQHGEAIATYTLKVIEEKDNGEDFDDILEKFCEIDGINEISSSGTNSDIYKYLENMYNLAKSEYKDNTLGLFNDSLYDELEIYNYHGNNDEYENDGTAKNAMLYWIIAMCLSEIFYTEDTTGSSTNIQTKIFKLAYDLGKESGYGRTIPLYGNYTPKGDVTICRLVASVVYAKSRRNYKSQIYSFRLRFNRSLIPLKSSYDDPNIWASSLNINRKGKGFNPNKIGYAVDIDDIFPSAAGPYVTNFTNANGVLQSNQNRIPSNTGDIFDNNYNYHIDNIINLEVINNYNLVNNSDSNKFKRTILAIADDYEEINHYLDDKIYYTYPDSDEDGIDITTYPHDTFKQGTTNNTRGHFTGVFNTSVVTSKNLSLYKYTQNFTDLLQYTKKACSANRFTTLDPLYGRKRPSQGTDDPSMYNLGEYSTLNWLDDYSILFLSGGSTKYDDASNTYYYDADSDNERDISEKNSYYQTGTVNANTYPSGHSAGVWGTALMLIELLSDMGSDNEEIYNIYKAAYAFTVSRTIVRAHWNSDTLYGKLNSTTIFPILHSINEYDTIYNNAKIALNSDPVARKIVIVNNTGAPAKITGEVYFFVEDENSGHKTLYSYIERCNGVSVNPYHTNNEGKYSVYTIPAGLFILCDLAFDWNDCSNGIPLYEDEINLINSPIRVYGIDNSGNRNKAAFICSNPTQTTLDNNIYIVKLTLPENPEHNIDIAYSEDFTTQSKTGVVGTVFNLPTLYIKENNIIHSLDKCSYWNELSQYLRYRFETNLDNPNDSNYATINEITGDITLNNTTEGYGNENRGLRCGVYITQNNLFSESNAHFYLNIVEQRSTNLFRIDINNLTGATAYITGEIYFYVKSLDESTTYVVYAHDYRNVANTPNNGSTNLGEDLNITLIALPEGISSLNITNWQFRGGIEPNETVVYYEHADTHNSDGTAAVDRGVRVYAHGNNGQHLKFVFDAVVDTGIGSVFNKGNDASISITITANSHDYSLMYLPGGVRPEPIPDPNYLYKVGLISDVHYCVPDSTGPLSFNGSATSSDNRSFYKQDLNKIIEVFKENNVEFVASPGDIATNSLNELIHFTRDYIKDFTGITENGNGTSFLSDSNYKKFYCALGNHDHFVVYSDTSKCKYLNYNNGVNTHNGQRWINVTYNGNTYNCPGILAGNNITYFSSNSKSYKITVNNGNDIYIFLSAFYGNPRAASDDGKGHDMSQMHPHNQMTDPLISVLKSYILLKYENGYIFPDNESNFNFQYYKYEDLIELKDILELNPSKRIFVFSHYFLTNKSGGNNEYPKDGTVDYKGGASTCLMGITFHFLNCLNNKFKNVIWFSGHSHFSWTYSDAKRGLHWTNKDYKYIVPTANDNSTILTKYDNNYYVVTTGNTPYNRLSSESNGTCGWNVHLPSLSRPATSSGSALSSCEAAIMYVYSDRVEIKKLGYSTSNGSTYNSYSSISDLILTINNDGTGSCSDNAPEINGGGGELPSSITNVPNDSIRFVISNNTDNTILFTGRFKLFFTNSSSTIDTSNKEECKEIDLFFRLPLKHENVLTKVNEVCTSVTKYDYLDNTDILNPGQKLVLTYKAPLSCSSSGKLKKLSFYGYKHDDGNTYKLIKSDGSSNGYRFVTNDNPKFYSYNRTTQYGTFSGNPCVKLQTALWYWTTPTCTSSKLWAKDANPIPCRIHFENNQNTTILLGKLYKLSVDEYIDTVKTNGGNPSNGYKKYYVNTTLVSPVTIDDSSLTIQMIG